MPPVLWMRDHRGSRPQTEPFVFEKWAVTRIPGLAPNRMQDGDRRIGGWGKILLTLVDGRGIVVAHVKSGIKMLPDHVRAFMHAIQGEIASMGISITLDARPSRQTAAEAADVGTVKVGAGTYPRLQFWTIEDYSASVAHPG